MILHQLKRLSPVVLAMAIFILTMVATVVAYQIIQENDTKSAQARFDFYKQSLFSKLNGQMKEYAQALRGAAGLFYASDEVTRSDWKHYVDTLDIVNYYPGIQGMGFVKYVTDDKKNEHIQRIHDEGMTDYEIIPAGRREAYGPIVYLEPFDWRNQRAFGYDMWSEKTRRNAMERARDSGNPALTSKVILMQETLQDTQVGFLMYAPIYEKSEHPQLFGFVYSPFRMKNFMSAVMEPVAGFLEVAIYDGNQVSAYDSMYDSKAGQDSLKALKPLFKEIIYLNIAEKDWTIVVESGPSFEAYVKSSQAGYVLFFGMVISVLLSVVAWTLATSRERAVRIADQMTTDLRESEERYALAVAGSSDGLWDWNVVENEIYYAPRLKKLLGYTENEGESTVKWAQNLVHPDDFEDGYAAFRNHLRNREPLDIEMRLQLKNKDYNWFRIKGQAIWDDKGRPLRMAGSISDINDRKLAAIYLQNQKQELEIANKYKSEFLANMSHELRTPLNSILVLSNLLAEDREKKLTDKQREQANIIYKSGADLLELISDILDLSKIEAGRMELHIDKLNIEDFANELKIMFEPIIVEKGLTFNIKIDKNVNPVIYTDHKRIYQVIKNLCSNAIKFTHEGGVSIHFYLPKSVAGINDKLDQHDALAISVTDTGLGIPQSKFELIFEAFKQVDGTTSRRYGGTGLGLTISREILSLLNGGVTLSSEEGVGSTFTVYFPMNMHRAVDEPPDQPIDKEALIASKPLEQPNPMESMDFEKNEAFKPYNAKILVVDDDIRNIYALTALLECYQCEVVSAQNGEEALKLLAKDNKFDLIFMDMMMPVMDGYQATSAIKHDDKLKDIPVIALTAKAMPGDKEQCMRAGADDYIAKPIKRQEIGHVLEHFLGKVNDETSN